MKKLLAFLAAFALLFSFAACGDTNSENNNNNNNNNNNGTSITTEQAFDKIGNALQLLGEQAQSAQDGFALGLEGTLWMKRTEGEDVAEINGNANLQMILDFLEVEASKFYSEYNLNAVNSEEGESGHAFWFENYFYAFQDGIKEKQPAPLSDILSELEGYDEGANFLPLLVQMMLSELVDESEIELPTDIEDPSELIPYIMGQLGQSDNFAFAVILERLAGAFSDSSLSSSLFSATSAGDKITLSLNFAPIKNLISLVIDNSISDFNGVTDKAAIDNILAKYPSAFDDLIFDVNYGTFLDSFESEQSFTQVITDWFEDNEQDFESLKQAIFSDGGDDFERVANDIYYSHWAKEVFFEWLSEHSAYEDLYYSIEVGETTIGEIFDARFEDYVLYEVQDIAESLSMVKACLPTEFTLVLEFTLSGVNLTGFGVSLDMTFKTPDYDYQTETIVYTPNRVEITLNITISRGDDVKITLPSNLSEYIEQE